jgi:flagellar basal body-associated protein FliL
MKNNSEHLQKLMLKHERSQGRKQGVLIGLSIAIVVLIIAYYITIFFLTR